MTVVLTLPRIDEVVCRGRLRWFGNVERGKEKIVVNLALSGVRRRGRGRRENNISKRIWKV